MADALHRAIARCRAGHKLRGLKNLHKLFARLNRFEVMRTSVYGEREVEVRYRVLDLLWKPA
ncbi:MAG: hypothetical protein KDN22_22090, partial [Verrucomicrobiae bacterium]|nr:hypothetical protein [Verrucomicrobiae bacterium]